MIIFTVNISLNRIIPKITDITLSKVAIDATVGVTFFKAEKNNDTLGYSSGMEY